MNLKLNDELVDNIYNKAISKTLKQLRKKHNYSFAQLSSMLNDKVARQTLCHYENGDTKVRIYMLKQLANIYNLTEEEMFMKITSNYFLELNKYLYK